MKRILLALALSSTLILGCGGGGGSSNVFGPQTIHTYVTDTFRDDYDQVWVRIYKVVLNGPTPAVLFDDPNGRVVDIRSLRDGAGPRYLFLDTAQAESAVYSELVVTLDKNLSIVPTGGNAAQAKQFSDVHDEAGKSSLRFSLLGFNLISNQSITVDFNLPAWTVEGSGKIRALIGKGDNAGINSQLRHEPDDFRGAITNLTGGSPNFTFTLRRNTGADLTVRTSNKTRIFNESGAVSPTLSNTAGVEVSGTFVGGNFFATSIKVEDLGGSNAAEIEGDPSTANEAAGTFRVTMGRAHNFIPDAKTYNIATDGATRYLSDTGVVITKAEFFAQLPTAASVEVEGTPGANSTIDATRVKLDTDENLNEVSVSGSLDTIGANSFSFSATQWQGLNLRIGDALTGELGGGTTYTLNGVAATKAEFFAAVEVNDVVKADGIINGVTLTVLRLSANP